MGVLEAIIGGISVALKGVITLIIFLIKGALILGIVALISYGIFWLIKQKREKPLENNMSNEGEDETRKDIIITEKHCHNCGAILEGDGKFCIICGQAVEMDENTIKK